MRYPFGMSKVLVSFPDDLLARIDREAHHRSVSRSALLALAARREIERADSGEVAVAIARSERRFQSAGSFESAEVVRRDRDRSE